jgi:two-component system response regulator YesN
MKILIVDDEKIVRKGLEKILSNEFINASIFSAKNGEEGLSIINEINPEIVITDIRMPVKDGIELMQDISKKENPPFIIVLSGYDDFQYAKKALLNGAKTYILKPVDKKELIESVSNCINKLEERDTVTAENILRILFNGGQIAKEKRVYLPKIDYTIICTGLVSSEFSCEALQLPNCYLLKNNRGGLILFVGINSIKKLKDLIIKYKINAGVSKISSTYLEMTCLYRQAFLAYLEFFFIVRKNKNVSSWNEYNLTPNLNENNKISSEISVQVSKLSIMIENASINELKCCFNDIFSYINDSSETQARKLYYFYESIKINIFERYSVIIEQEVYLQIKKIMVDNITVCESLNDWLVNVTSFVYYLNKYERLVTEEYPFIIEAMQYMKYHYTEQINMIQVANQVSVNYTYFSEMFKKYTKINFNKYLTLLRIEESKKLLEKGCYKVYEVATRSGFGDEKYFMKKFKEETGMSPTQYRKSFL